MPMATTFLRGLPVTPSHSLLRTCAHARSAPGASARLLSCWPRVRGCVPFHQQLLGLVGLSWAGLCPSPCCGMLLCWRYSQLLLGLAWLAPLPGCMLVLLAALTSMLHNHAAAR